MVTDFQERLRQIREQRSRESRAQKEVEAEADRQRRTAIERRLDRREQIERVIEALSDKFMSEISGFTRSKSFFEGKYKIELSHDDLIVDESGNPRKLYTRIAFLIDTTSSRGSFSVICKRTVRNRDQESTFTEIDLGSDSLEEFERFAETQFFELADLYFAGQSAPTNGSTA